MSYYDLIYKAASESTSKEDLEKKLNKLKRLGNFNIDDKKREKNTRLEFTAASKLAYEKKFDQVEWLRELGADTDNIAHSYAMKGCHEQVETYFLCHGATSTTIAHGYAVSGDDERVEMYRKNHKANRELIAQGYAEGGHFKQVKTYYETYQVAPDYIARGYAMYGNHKGVDEYRGYGASTGMIAEGYAAGGYHAYVDRYFKEDPEIADDIAKGYARGGYHKEVETYRRKYGASVEAIADGYFLRGDNNKVKEYDLKKLLESYLEKKTASHEAHGHAKKYKIPLFSFFQKTFEQKEAAVSALLKALRGNPVDDLNTHLSTLNKGTLGQQLNAFIKAGKAKDLVGPEVHTIKGFVKALQVKIEKKLTT
jgi:hypothetical protein